MKFLIVTRADKNVANIAKLTMHHIVRYAGKCGASISVLHQNVECRDKLGRIHYRIMEFYKLLEEYDRILHLDIDTLILPNCPNLFEIVPYEKIGTVLEDKGPRKGDRITRIRSIQHHWGDVGWWVGYINTGVFLVSKPHKEIFQRFKGQLWTKWRGYDDLHLGFQIHRLGFEVFELDYKFNHMSMFSQSWNNNASRFNSYIIHYAGHANFPDKGRRSRIQLIKDDIQEIYGEKG